MLQRKANKKVEDDDYIYEEYQEKVAENIWFLPVYGRVKDGKEKIDAATVRLYKENEIVKTFETPKNGKFEMELDLGSYYTIEVEKDGYVGKRIGINTVSDIEMMKMQYLPYGVDIHLTSKDEYVGVSTDILDYPFALVSYDHKDRMFLHDEGYTEGMTSENDRLLRTALRLSLEENKRREF